MKFVFIDEFKPVTQKNNDYILYGLTAIIIDSMFYNSYRVGFEKGFQTLGWTKDKELKGRYTYSKAVFEEISIDQRILFARDLFKLSSSKSGKKRVISAIVSFDNFNKNISERDIYIDLLSRICKKLGKPVSKKLGKNIICFILDNNDAVTKKLTAVDFYDHIYKKINSEWLIFERPFFVASSSLSPGLVFADFVSFFHQNFIDTKKFFNTTKLRFLELLGKEESQLTNLERKELESFIINYKKQKQSLQVITVLKDIIYI